MIDSRAHSWSEPLRRELAARHVRLSRGGLVIDGDAHLSDPASCDPAAAARWRATSNYYHGRPITAEALIAELDMAGVDMALVWQNPAATCRGADRAENYEALLAANRYIHAAAQRWPDRLIPAGWTDPGGLGLDGALRLVEVCVREMGFLVVKMNPAQNRFPIDAAEVFAVTDRIRELGAIPAFHVGGDTPFTPAAGLERVAEHCAPDRVIAVHMGGGGSGYVEGESLYQDIRALGLRRPNLFFVQSAKRDCHIESDFITYELAGGVHATQIGVGSDAPYGRVAWNFGGYRAMFASLRDPRHPDERLRARPGCFDAEAESRYLGGNLAGLLAAGYARWLEKGGAA